MTQTPPLTADDILGPGGRIADRISHYEHRDEQLQMARAVAEAVRSRHHLVVEAGTGVGKSFAYLVPGILAVTEPDANEGQECAAADAQSKRPRRIVVSTHTISLQEQLMNSDLPMLNSVIPREFAAVLVKGRGNYLSRRRLDRAWDRRGHLFGMQDDVAELKQVYHWAQETYDGSISDLPRRPGGRVWDEVASDSGNCMGKSCRTYDSCFYYAARRRVRNAQVLVVNHALLCSDLALRQLGVSILPEYDILVIDEAHTLEGVAGDHLGVRVTSGQVDYLLNRLYNSQTQKGMFCDPRLQRQAELVDTCHAIADDFFLSLGEWQEEFGRTNGRVNEPGIVANQLSDSLVELADVVATHAERLVEESDKFDALSQRGRLLDLAGRIRVWTEQSESDLVYWLEVHSGRKRRRGHAMSMVAAPVDVGATLKELLFDEVPTVILASATLAVGKKRSFDFFRARLGLETGQTLQLGSPFNYREQAKLVVLADMPDPGEEPTYTRACAKMVEHSALETQGRSFVLFTSYAMMQSIGRLLEAWARRHEMRVISQQDGVSRARMVEEFCRHERSVLLGADSFWQGVDVPGDALQTVIVAKLPFSVPDKPLLEARLEEIRASGGVPFQQYQLPEAVIKFKQGFGRLIRRRTDTGRVVCLDPRIVTKPYGRTFLESLPDCEIERQSWQQLRTRVEVE